MTSKRSLRWTCALVVTAAAALIPGAMTSSAVAQAQGTAPQLVTPRASTGWHGEPVRRPLPSRDAARISAAPAGQALALGSGYGRPAGSGAVRALQRILLRLGYASGPADGLFGPRTQGSLAWFQIKHGLRPTGTADAATLRVVRQRDRARSSRPGQATSRTSSPAPRPAPAAAAQRPPNTTPAAGTSGGIGVLPLILLLAGGAALLSLLATVASRRARRSDLAPRARAQAAARARSVGTVLHRVPARLKAAAAAMAAPRRRVPAPASDGARAESTGPSAIGYTIGQDAAELERQAAAIEQACSERGWTLASIVREDASVASNGHTAPALALALDRLARGDASRLVTGRLDHLARSLANLGRLLDWCTRHGVDLVAVDVGLDTSTRDGRLAARCLLAAGHGNGAVDRASAGSQSHSRQTRAGGGAREEREGPIATVRRRLAR